MTDVLKDLLNLPDDDPSLNPTDPEIEDKKPDTTIPADDPDPVQDEWQKERNGLLKGIKEERRKRQEFQSRLDVLTGTVNAILEKRSNSAADTTGDKNTDLDKIILETDEDGNDVLPVSKIQELLSPLQQEVLQLKQLLATQGQQTQADVESQRVLQNILSEDERFPVAYRDYTKAREWANNKVVEFSQENGINRPMSGTQALNHVFNDELEGEFKKLFPNADLDAVVLEGPRSFRKALKSFVSEPTSVAPTKPAQESTKDSRFQKVLQKPSGLADAKNSQKAAPVMERVGQLSTADIMNLSDSEVDALQQAVLHEEQSDGVKF